jgi:hypothetical protein
MVLTEHIVSKYKSLEYVSLYNADECIYELKRESDVEVIWEYIYLLMALDRDNIRTTTQPLNGNYWEVAGYILDSGCAKSSFKKKSAFKIKTKSNLHISQMPEPDEIYKVTFDWINTISIVSHIAYEYYSVFEFTI